MMILMTTIMTMKTVLQDITNYNSNNDVVRDNIDNDDNKKECSSLCYQNDNNTNE